MFGRRSRTFTPRVLVLTVLVFAAGMGVSYGIYQIQVEPVQNVGEYTIGRMAPASLSSPEQSVAATAADAGGRLPAARTARPRNKSNLSGKVSAAKPEPNERPTASKMVVAQISTANPPVVAASSASTAAVTAIASKTDHRPVGGRKADRDTTPSAVADIENIRRANMRRSLDISRLIAEIQQSMHVSDHRRTEKLLKQLTRRKGRNDPYVMKLQSYWHTQQGDLGRASALLQKVLQRKPDDLEAGINMAILEIKAGQIRQADERLSRLREIYPEDTRIPDLMEKLKS